MVMEQSQIGEINGTKTTYFRIIDALLAAWGEEPSESFSLRGVARAAGVSPSAIPYHFGDFDHLYLVASQAALDEARAWMAARLALTAPLAAAGGPVPLALQAALISAAIADWTQDQRRLAMALRHAPGREWLAAWTGFWQDFAAQVGLAQHASRLALFAAGEAARHLLVWNPPLSRALLEETVTALLAWLEQGRLGADTVRQVHRAAAAAAYRPPEAEPKRLTAEIAEAAGALLAEGGHAAVTFRAVAERAGVTLGTVIHHCGTKSELLEAALHRLYRREALRDDPAQFIARTIAPPVMLGHLLGTVLAGQQPVLRAFDEIELAIYNGAEFSPLRGVIRSMEDPSGAWALQQMLGGQTPPASLVAAFSAITRGIGFHAAHGVGAAEAAAGPALEIMAREALSPFVLAT
jgi:AcrR family transcriptional regulator